MIGLSGCATTDAPTPAESVAPSDLPEIGNISSDPLQVYASRSNQDFALIQRGLEASAIPCMKRAGFDFESQVPDALAARPSFVVDFRLDTELVSEFGYAGPPTPEPSPDPASEMSEETAIAFEEALWGSSKDPDTTVSIRNDEGDVVETYARGGCMGAAELLIFEDPSAYESARRQLEGARAEALTATFADPRLQATETDWRTCMKRFGHDFDAPRTVVDQVGDAAKAEAIRVALHDAECRDETAYGTTGNQLFWAYEQRWVDRNLGAVQDFEQLWKSALTNSTTASES